MDRHQGLARGLSTLPRPYTLVLVDFYGRQIGHFDLGITTGPEARKKLTKLLAKEMRKSAIVAGGYAHRHGPGQTRT